MVGKEGSFGLGTFPLSHLLPPQDPSFPLRQDQLQGNHRGRKAADKSGIAGKQKPAGGTWTGLRRSCPKSVPQLGRDLLPPRHLHPAAPLLLLAAPHDASGIKKVGDPAEDTYGLPIWLGAELKLAGEGRGVTRASGARPWPLPGPVASGL